MEKYLKIDKISDVSNDKWALLSQKIKKDSFYTVSDSQAYGPWIPPRQKNYSRFPKP